MNAHTQITTRQPLSPENRARLRTAVKTHSGWSAYRSARGLDLSAMTTDQLWSAVEALHIDPAKHITMTEPPRAGTWEARSENVDPPRLDLTSKPAAVSAPKEAAPMNAHTPPNADTAQQLAALIGQLAGQHAKPVDMDQVNAAIDAKADQLARNMAALVADMAQNAPRQLITLQRQDGTTFDVQGHAHPQLSKLLRVAGSRMASGFAPNIWLAGPAGSGKTHAAETVAKALARAFHYNGAISMAFELVGFIDAAGKYHRTPFREAYEHGGVYLFDEVDGSDNSALLALNAALANGRATFPDGQVERHPDCVIIATGNTWGLGATAEYVGRAKIDAAFLSRFPVRISWDYDADLEQAISGNADFAKRVQKARTKARAAGIKVLIDPRASQAGAALIAAGMSADEAAELTYLANLSADQRKIVEA